MSTGAIPAGFQDPNDLSDLSRSLRRPRSLFSWAMSVVTGAMTIAALVPLVSVLYLLITRGGKLLGASLFTELPPAAMAVGGGFGNAIVGTLVMVTIAAILSVPFGILAAVFIAEFDSDSRTATAVRFCAKVLTGLPSILAAVLAYAPVAVLTGGFSPPAGRVAPAVLIARTLSRVAREPTSAAPAPLCAAP